MRNIFFFSIKQYIHNLWTKLSTCTNTDMDGKFYTTWLSLVFFLWGQQHNIQLLTFVQASTIAWRHLQFNPSRHLRTRRSLQGSERWYFARTSLLWCHRKRWRHARISCALVPKAMAKVWESPFCYVISMQQNIKLVQNESFGIGWNIYAPNREK